MAEIDQPDRLNRAGRRMKRRRTPAYEQALLDTEAELNICVPLASDGLRLARRIGGFSALVYDKVNSLNQVSSQQRTKIIRFVDTHSHPSYEDGLLNMDMTILGETGSVLKDLLDLIKKVDKEHYSLLEQSIKS